jgi:hypothetical protein
VTLVYSSPPVPVAPRVNPFPGLRHTFTGWDGQVWDLSDWSTAGVFLTAGGLRGLDHPETEDFTDEYAGMDGQVLTGFKVVARSCFWPILVWSDVSTDEWLDRDAAFWESLEPGRVGTWTVTRPDGSSRSLRVRCTPEGDTSFDMDPSSAGWMPYGIKLVADDPYWTSEPVPREFSVEEPTDFTGTEDEDQDGFFVWGGSSLAEAEIVNDGRVPAWPIWTLVGPLTDPIIGVGGKTIECPTVADGDTLVIDTSPRVRSALLNGVDATADLGDAEFAPVPAGGSQSLSVVATGAGAVYCSITPRHYKAWGRTRVTA